MSLSTFALILISVSLSALAQISFKFGVSAYSTAGGPATSVASALFSPGVLIGLALYGIGTLLWLGVLSRTEVSQAYPFVALGFALTAILGRLIFGDDLSAMRIGGIALVVVGVFIIARS